MDGWSGTKVILPYNCVVNTQNISQHNTNSHCVMGKVRASVQTVCRMDSVESFNL